MTACGNKMSGVCGGCAYLQSCRNNEIANLPKTNIEFMHQSSAEELAEFLSRYIGICAVCKHSEECDYEEIISTYKCPYGDDNRKAWEMWLKEKHNDL